MTAQISLEDDLGPEHQVDGDLEAPDTPQAVEDEKTTAQKIQEDRGQNPIEVLAPKSEPPVVAEEEEVERMDPRPREWVLGPEGDRRTFVQKPLPFLPKMRFMSLLGRTMRAAMLTGDQGAISELLGGAGTLRERAAALGEQDFQDVEQFIGIAASLASHLPEFFEQAYCIALNVPPAQQPWVLAMMQEGEEDGGFSDQQGIEIIKVFIAQNAEALRDFFTVLLPDLWRTTKAEMPSNDTAPPSSKPSSTTPQSTEATA